LGCGTVQLACIPSSVARATLTSMALFGDLAVIGKEVYVRQIAGEVDMLDGRPPDRRARQTAT
jgi:hypothetical protein